MWTIWCLCEKCNIWVKNQRSGVMTCSYIWPTNLYLWRQEACGIGCLMKGSTKLKQRFLVSSFFPPSLRLCDPEKENTFFGLGRPFFFVLYFFPFFVFIFLLADRTVAQKRATKRGGRREAPPPFLCRVSIRQQFCLQARKKKTKKKRKKYNTNAVVTTRSLWNRVPNERTYQTKATLLSFFVFPSYLFRVWYYQGHGQK